VQPKNVHELTAKEERTGSAGLKTHFVPTKANTTTIPSCSISHT